MSDFYGDWKRTNDIRKQQRREMKNGKRANYSFFFPIRRKFKTPKISVIRAKPLPVVPVETKLTKWQKIKQWLKKHFT